MIHRDRDGSSGAPRREPQRGPQRAQRANGRARRTPFVLVVLGLLGGGLVALLALNTASAANEVERSALVSQDQNVAAELVQLQNQDAASAAPGNLASAAAALGMVPAGDPGFLEVARNGTVTVLGHPLPASLPPVVVAPAPAAATPTPTPTATATAGHAAPGASPSPHGHGATATVTVTATPTRPAHHRRHARTATRRVHPHGATPSATPTTSAPSPSPTPTPETSLPGGNR